MFASVFPAPDSPLTTMPWLAEARTIEAYAFSAIAYTCGPHAQLYSRLPRHCAITFSPYSPLIGLNGLTATRMSPTSV